MFGHAFNSGEKRVLQERTMAHLMAGMTPGQARRQAKQDLKEAIAASKAEGWYGRGPQGINVLNQYKTDPTHRRLWEAMKAQGVRDEDVVEWWDLPDIERRLMLRDDDVFRLTAWMERMDAGHTAEQAARIIWQMRPMFGDPLGPPTFPDDDTSTMLAVEIKLRFLRWSESLGASGERVERMKRERAQFSTMNGYIRHLIGQGTL